MVRITCTVELTAAFFCDTEHVDDDIALVLSEVHIIAVQLDTNPKFSRLRKQTLHLFIGNQLQCLQIFFSCRRNKAARQISDFLSSCQEKIIGVE